MQARKNTSKKWTGFPEEFLQQVEEIFRQNFAKKIGESKLVVEGRIYAEEIVLRVGIREKGRLKQSNFEVSIDYKSSDPNSLDRIHDLVDVAASMMADYFEKGEELDFPYQWKEFPFNGKPVFLQFSTENSELESQADAILGLREDSLVREDAPGEDLLGKTSAGKRHLH